MEARRRRDQIVVVPAKQLDQKRFLGIEMVVQAASWIPAASAMVVHRRTKARRRYRDAAVSRTSARRVPSS